LTAKLYKIITKPLCKYIIMTSVL